jgi:hypothetical protein
LCSVSFSIIFLMGCCLVIGFSIIPFPLGTNVEAVFRHIATTLLEANVLPPAQPSPQTKPPPIKKSGSQGCVRRTHIRGVNPILILSKHQRGTPLPSLWTARYHFMYYNPSPAAPCGHRRYFFFDCWIWGLLSELFSFFYCFESALSCSEKNFILMHIYI